jgi:hypothetical protein
MAFLDNSGDIILDAVLTDTGRFRLAKGDGSFKIVKFALGDDEINYQSFNKNHPSGSAFYDLDILQTPVLEAFTNNASSLQSKLVSIPRTNLLYLPILKLNELKPDNIRHSTGAFIVATTEKTEDDVMASAGTRSGVLKGARPNGGGSIIRVDQGLDTTEISPSFTIDADLVETQFIIEIDNRFANVCDVDGNSARVSFIDDDNIASYYLSLGTDTAYIRENTQRDLSPASEAIAGPRGTILELKLKASIDLATSTFLFVQLGDITTVNGISVYYIDTTLRITGATTGFQIDIPVRFIKEV